MESFLFSPEEFDGRTSSTSRILLHRCCCHHKIEKWNFRLFFLFIYIPPPSLLRVCGIHALKCHDFVHGRKNQTYTHFFLGFSFCFISRCFIQCLTGNKYIKKNEEIFHGYFFIKKYFEEDLFCLVFFVLFMSDTKSQVKLFFHKLSIGKKFLFCI